MIANVATSQNWRNTLDLSVSEGLKNLPEIFSFLTFQTLESMPIQRVQFRGEKNKGFVNALGKQPFLLIWFCSHAQLSHAWHNSFPWHIVHVTSFSLMHAYTHIISIIHCENDNVIVSIGTRISNYFHYPTTNKTVFCFLRSYDLFNPTLTQPHKLSPCKFTNLICSCIISFQVKNFHHIFLYMLSCYVNLHVMKSYEGLDSIGFLLGK
jgi:hypothetical protein